ncbi:MAG: hypothetical protein ACRDPG_06980 [Nocardioidaceae bacterium]
MLRSIALLGVGAVCVVVGAVFTLQGLGYLSGSPMTGVAAWAIIGPIMVLLGLALVVRVLDRRSSDR